jgi:hypothetical protein
VRVTLVAHVPDELVPRRVENIVQGDGQLDDAETGREVPADAADDIDHAVTDVLRELRKVGLIQLPQVRR